MATYGISKYGGGTYGAASLLLLESSLTASPSGHGQIALTWNPPGATWSHQRVVRSSYGYPSWVGEGTVLFEDTYADARVTHVDGLDADLTQGRFYYYTLFVYITADSTWVAAGTAMALVTKDYGTGDSMWELLPSFYRDDDVALSGENGFLRRFLDFFAYPLNQTRTETATLLDVYDIDKVSGGLLPMLAEMLGRDYEPELGMIRSRAILNNAIYMAKMKGTRPGIEAVATSYTGYGAEAQVGVNLMLDTNDSNFAGGVGHWTATNAAIARWPEASYTPAIVATDSLKVTGNGVGTVFLYSGTGARIPVTAGTTYTASAYFRVGTTGRNYTLSISWWDIDGVELAPTSSGAIGITSGAWVRVSATGAAPVGAVSARLVISIPSVINNEVHYVGAVQFEQAGSASTWESARKIKIYFDPKRINEVINSSFEDADISAFSVVSGTVTRSSSRAYSGTYSLKVSP